LAESTLVETTAAELLLRAIERDYPTIRPSTDPARSRSPALRVIDCVLSLNRRYDAFVVPRLVAFEHAWPTVTSVLALRELIDSFASPIEFMEHCLNYRDAARAITLRRVVDYLIITSRQYEGSAEEELLQRWAVGARPSDFTKVRAAGFGLAGFQYLRMLSAQTQQSPTSTSVVMCHLPLGQN